MAGNNSWLTYNKTLPNIAFSYQEMSHANDTIISISDSVSAHWWQGPQCMESHGGGASSSEPTSRSRAEWRGWKLAVASFGSRIGTPTCQERASRIQVLVNTWSFSWPARVGSSWGHQCRFHLMRSCCLTVLESPQLHSPWLHQQFIREAYIASEDYASCLLS